MAWQENSIMASKGLAKGKAGIRHMITEADQGKYHYVYGPYVKPVLAIEESGKGMWETLRVTRCGRCRQRCGHMRYPMAEDDG